MPWLMLRGTSKSHDWGDHGRGELTPSICALVADEFLATKVV